MHGAWIPSLVWELRSHIPCHTAKKKKKSEKFFKKWWDKRKGLKISRTANCEKVSKWGNQRQIRACQSGLLYVPFWCQNHPAADENVLFLVEERERHPYKNVCPAFKQGLGAGRAFLYLFPKKNNPFAKVTFQDCTFCYPSKACFSSAQKLNFSHYNIVK